MNTGHSNLRFETGHFAIYTNQKGSVILVVMMILVMMSVIGIASTNTSTTESLIVRNTGIHQQDLYILDSVAAEALQNVLDAGYVSDGNDGFFFSQDEITPDTSDTLAWIHSKDTWDWTNWNDLNFPGAILDKNNSAVPNLADDSTGVARILTERGEWDASSPDPDNSPIRYALVGWDVIDANADQTVDKQRRAASILVEYISEEYGVMRLVIGVQRMFKIG